MKYLGKDKYGYTYYRKGNYIYQKYPPDTFRNGHDVSKRGAGWFCSCAVWERTLHKVLKGI